MNPSANREMMERAALQARALVYGVGVLAMAGVSEMPGAGAQMLRSLLGHELVASHALMMQLTGKTPQFLALIGEEHTPEQQDRGCRQTVQLTAAIARLIDRYRLGLMGLARLEQQSAKEAHRRAAGLAAADSDDDDPEDDGPRGGRKDRDLAKLLAAMAAERRKAARDLDGSPPGGNGIGAATSNARRGRLKHGNPSGDFAKAPRCGARTRAGHPCGQPAMTNGHCRMHGGCSTGARTAEGLARCRTARLVHGCRTAEIIELKSAAARHGRALRTLTRAANAMARPQSERPTPCQATPERLVGTERMTASVGHRFSDGANPLIVTPAKAGAHKHGPRNDETLSRQWLRCPAAFVSRGFASDIHADAAPSVFMGPGFRRGDNREEANYGEYAPRSARMNLTDTRFERPTPCQANRRRA